MQSLINIMVKKITCIRHGTALHNVMFDKIGVRAYSDYMDTPLVERGVQESKELGNIWDAKSEIDTVFVSPAFRTLDTATNIFNPDKKKNIRMIALDCLIEYPCSDNCNRRQDLKTLNKLYPHIDFSQIKNEVYIEKESESMLELKERIHVFNREVLKTENKGLNIAMVGHSSYIKTMMGLDVGDERNELKHCFPYEVSIEYTDKHNNNYDKCRI